MPLTSWEWLGDLWIDALFGFGVLVAIVALVPLSHDIRMHTDVLVANNSNIVIPEQKQDQEEDKGSTLSKILRTNELLRYLDDHVFDDFLHLIEKRTFQKGEIITNVEQFSMRMPSLKTFRRIGSRGSLVPMSALLSILVNFKDNEDSARTISCSTGHDKLLSRLSFVASCEVKLYVVPHIIFTKWLARETTQARLHLIQETLRRYYFVVFPMCTTYLGLEEQVANSLISASNASNFPDGEGNLNTHPMKQWFEQARKYIAEHNDAKLGLPDGANGAVTSSASTKLQRTDTLSLPKALAREEQNVKNQVELHTKAAARRPALPSLQTSSFGRSRRRSSGSAIRSALASTNGSRTHRRSRSAESRQGRERDFERTFGMKLAVAREILKGLNFEESVVDDSDSDEAEPDLADLRAPLTVVEKRSISGTDPFEHLVREFADYIEVIHYACDAKIVSIGQEYFGVLYVLDGQLSFKTHRSRTGEDEPDGDLLRNQIGPGGLVGKDCVLPNNKAIFDIVASKESIVGVLPKARILGLGLRFPRLFFLMGTRLLAALSDLLMLTDYAIEWNQLQAGDLVNDRIAHQGLAILLKGRIRVNRLNSKGDSHIRDIGVGEVIHSLYLLSQKRSPSEMICLRKSELINIQLRAYEALALREPLIALSLSRSIATSFNIPYEETAEHSNTRDSNFFKPRTLAVLAMSLEVPIESFTARLVDAITATNIMSLNEIVVLDADKIIEEVGGDVFNNAGNVRLESYVARTEENAGVTLLVGEISPHSTWNRTCITHADSIILVGMANNLPSLTEMDQTLRTVGTRGRIELVLLHEDFRICRAGLTSAWLKHRPWITGGHHHVLMQRTRQGPGDSTLSVLKEDLADFYRLARRLFGRSIALILGGGGARGIAHLGFMRAMEEHGISVDIIAGSSMGACVGGVFARTLNVVSTMNRIKALSARIRLSTFLFDFTYPYVAKTTGAAFQREILSLFGDLNLNDLWLEYYCAVTNITKNCVSQMQSEDHAATSIAASMSYTGMVPPTCINGDMLVDGCYSCNLPARRARALGAEHVIVVDVSALDPLGPQNYGSTLSGWQVMYHSFKAQFSRKKTEDGSRFPPTSSAILERLTQGTSLRELEVIKNTPGCYYIALPVNQYSARDPSKLEELVEIGYQAGRKWFSELEASQSLHGWAIAKTAAKS